MMKPTKLNKLSLSHETIRQLSDTELVGANGGLDTLAQCKIRLRTAILFECLPTTFVHCG